MANLVRVRSGDHGFDEVVAAVSGGVDEPADVVAIVGKLQIDVVVG